MWLLLAFVTVPLIEIALFINVGGAIGLWPTLAIVLATAFLGTWLVRTQGLMAIGNLQRSFAELNDPTEPLAHGAMILISGAMLMMPGFFTDAIGFSLLVPAIRSGVFHYLRRRVTVTSFSMGGSQTTYNTRTHAGEDVIDGEFSEVDSPSDPSGDSPRNPSLPPSGWTKH
ncbi:phage T7 F exclusion suppressor FxsA [Shimia sp. SK013]|uniref:FxsA family protein n=1 Tax=Shimia sp. SK013 TaxID=1389006 RepID=UPI0006B4FFE7|nr:FxsA family protein [Shimia sp. SK013]KPA19845.1 phage T7 F exclusion suppressor FxsA [Shimia sp. SK013]